MVHTAQREPAYLRPRGVYWRFVGALLVFQAIGFGCAAGLAYLIISPELAKDYFSAHRTVKDTWRLVVPALAVAAAAGFAVVGAGTAFGLRSHSRRLLEPLRRIDALLRGLAAGRIPAAEAGANVAGVDAEVAAALEPLRSRARDLRQISRDLQKVSLELNYRSAGTTEVTRKDLRALATQLDALSQELTRTSGWFEG